MKQYYIQYGIGKAKYLVNHCDGLKTHRDGSKAWDIALFKNKKKMGAFISGLQSNGYTESNS